MASSATGPSEREREIEWSRAFVQSVGGPNYVKSAYVRGRNMQLMFDFNEATKKLLIFTNVHDDWESCSKISVNPDTGEIMFEHPRLGGIRLCPNNGFINGTTDRNDSFMMS